MRDAWFKSGRHRRGPRACAILGATPEPPAQLTAWRLRRARAASAPSGVPPGTRIGRVVVVVESAEVGVEAEVEVEVEVEAAERAAVAVAGAMGAAGRPARRVVAGAEGAGAGDTRRSIAA